MNLQINKNKPQRYWYYDIEKNQISKIRGTKRFRDGRRIWKQIQENILLILKERDTNLFDEWLECLVRGRYLFFRKKFKHQKSLTMFYDIFEGQGTKTAIESETMGLLRDLIDSTFDRED